MHWEGGLLIGKVFFSKAEKGDYFNNLCAVGGWYFSGVPKVIIRWAVGKKLLQSNQVYSMHLNPDIP